jgi:hypothetical protein
MAKRKKATRQASGAPTTADTMEGRVLAFAEQLGRIAGTVQARADGWMNHETLTRQMAGVRDGAAELLEQLGLGATPAKKTAPAKRATSAKTTPAAKAAPRKTKGRSGGVVDAPGKKRRRRLPADPDATRAASQHAKMRQATPMAKTHRLRGRG